jgi:excisionase family DNA binding protein
MKVTEVAETLAIDRSTAYRMIQRGELPAVRISESSVRVPRAGFEAYMRARETGGAIEPVRVGEHPPHERAQIMAAVEAFEREAKRDPFDFVEAWRAGTIEDNAENSELVIEALSLRKAMAEAGITPATA